MLELKRLEADSLKLNFEDVIKADHSLMLRIMDNFFLMLTNIAKENFIVYTIIKECKRSDKMDNFTC